MTAIARLMFASLASGSGKTMVTCAFLQALKNRGKLPAAFKCGPDYIDPMFHSRVLGMDSHNLDLFFAPEQIVRGLVARHTRQKDIAVIEGAMGYYDGAASGTLASSWSLAHATGTPVILVIDPKGMSLSLAAVVKGVLAFRSEHHVAGLLLNPCPQRLYSALRPMLEEHTGIPVLGYLPHLPECTIPSRHLGLVTAAEIADLHEKVQAMAGQMEQSVDIARLLAIARSAPELDAAPLPAQEPVTEAFPVIAVARDPAFCFYYDDNLQLLRELGAKLAFFSPLADQALPPGTDAIYLGGGYPELHAPALCANVKMREVVRAAMDDGMPVLAECGGFQYLQNDLITREGERCAMVGALDSESAPQQSAGRFGYITLHARQDNMLCKQGERIAAHEYHRWDSQQTGESFLAVKPDGREWNCIIARDNLFAGYPHLYFYSNISFAANFVRAAAAYQCNRPAGAGQAPPPDAEGQPSTQSGRPAGAGQAPPPNAEGQPSAQSGRPAGAGQVPPQHLRPGDIERRSFEIITRELGSTALSLPEETVLKRVIHTTADFDFAANLWFSPGAVEQGLEALQSGAVIITDTNMSRAGINRGGLHRLGARVECFVADEDVAAAALRRGTTRAAAAMRKAADLTGPLIVAVGNAPTALYTLYDLITSRKLLPKLIIAVPVGFVNVEESKELILSAGLPCIVAKGRKGGSTVATAICNSLIYQAVDRQPDKN